MAQFVERAADQIERFSNHLRERDLNDLVGEAQRFARQQPAMFIGSSFAAGMLAARFIKASRPTRSFDDRSYSGYGGEGGGSGAAFNRGDTSTAARRAPGRRTAADAAAILRRRHIVERSTSFETPTDRPGDVTGRGGPVMEPRKTTVARGAVQRTRRATPLNWYRKEVPLRVPS